ncbi:PHP domain-containing protein [Thermosipho ferrireducens]|uniref:Histidinol-phosphatase n=1 Tax=Thermosipho ferrireducens TaxID=2571116 RepID=A0ABX7SAH5_9BACT|nr:PHP domain-containing protein [Thermosipho ferrireducens]QTA38431.1 PHP domain-containing protein [Thermosipho ferrireducens]
MLMDYHIHSNFSPDSKASVEQIIKTARSRGIESIIITDHYELSNSLHDTKFDVNEYRKTMEKHCLPVGVEFGWDGKKEIDIDLKQFDFVILSYHNFDTPVNQKEYKKYLENLFSIIKKFDSYHVLGHLDFPRRYHENYEAFSKKLFPLIEDIFKEIILNGKGIEVNTESMLKYGEPNPSIDILKIYKNSGGEFITIGSDAHKIENIGRNVKSALDLLKEIGFKYVSTLNSEWNMIKIDI